ncbi:hypothetical protein EBZ80_18510 [bacterium]|nr:hypothetical protein [bacterium]
MHKQDAENPVCWYIKTLFTSSELEMGLFESSCILVVTLLLSLVTVLAYRVLPGHVFSLSWWRNARRRPVLGALAVLLIGTLAAHAVWVTIRQCRLATADPPLKCVLYARICLLWICTVTLCLTGLLLPSIWPHVPVAYVASVLVLMTLSAIYLILLSVYWNVRRCRVSLSLHVTEAHKTTLRALIQNSGGLKLAVDVSEKEEEGEDAPPPGTPETKEGIAVYVIEVVDSRKVSLPQNRPSTKHLLIVMVCLDPLTLAQHMGVTEYVQVCKNEGIDTHTTVVPWSTVNRTPAPLAAVAMPSAAHAISEFLTNACIGAVRTDTPRG